MSLFATLARMSKWRVGEFMPQNFALTVWAYATASQSDVSLFAALASRAAPQSAAGIILSAAEGLGPGPKRWRQHS